jgi:hypothetical protein
LGEQDKIDAWFEAKTKGLNDWQKAALREQWGTMQRVLSSRSRMERVVSDIDFDFSVKARLSDQRGNAILVASSIFEACKYFELFQKIADLRAKRVDYAEYLRRIARLHVRPGTDLATREAVLAAWYRQQIKDAVPSLLGTWAPRIGVAVPGFYVQQMRTRWGSSNPAAGNIRLNTELAKKSMECLEYIVVHELLHLPARTHPRRALRGADGPAHAGVAGQAGTAEPAAGEA